MLSLCPFVCSLIILFSKFTLRSYKEFSGIIRSFNKFKGVSRNFKEFQRVSWSLKAGPEYQGGGGGGSYGDRGA